MSDAVTLVDTNSVQVGTGGNPMYVAGNIAPSGLLPAGATALFATSGTVGNATAAAVLGNAAGQTTYISGFDVTGTGATAASGITVTAGVLIGNLTGNYTLGVPAGNVTPITPLTIQFTPPIPAVSANANITVSAPTFGAGNLKATVNAYGFRV